MICDGASKATIPTNNPPHHRHRHNSTHMKYIQVLTKVLMAIKLSHRQNDVTVKSRPTTPVLFLHGLDSSSHTWRHILSDLEALERPIPSVALDLRGCGYSDLGDPKDFNPDSLVEDIHEFVSSSNSGHEYFQRHNSQKFVLCGHSMGGRIAMSYAAKYPEDIAALIIEDMDIRERAMSSNKFQRKKCNLDREATISFDRHLTDVTTDDEVVKIFEEEGYPKDSVKKWITEGRIVINGGNFGNGGSTYYSEVNPAFRLLCYEQFFITNHGETTWHQIASNIKFKFPCHVMVANSEGTVCDNDSIFQMQNIMNVERKDLRMILHRYDYANHSIHNSERKMFMKDLEWIVRNVID